MKMLDEKSGLSVVIPAYNEEKGVGDVIRKLQNILENSGCDYEIIVVDDGSTDKTANIVRETGVRSIQHPFNRGYGAAMKTGIRQAQHDIVVITDADGTYPNERIPDLLTRLAEGEYDMVVGARTGDSVAIPVIRRLAKWAVGRLANLIAGERIPDINSGLRVFRRQAMLHFFGILPDTFSFTATITLAMLSNGYLIDYVPIDYHARTGRSKFRPIRDTWNLVKLILRIALYFAPLKIFLPLSVLLLLLAIGWGLFTRFALGQLADVSTIVIVMTAIQVAVVGLLAELIDRRLPNYYREER